MILGLLATWLLYLFFKNMPTDLPPVSERYDRRFGRLLPGLPGPHAWQTADDGQDAGEDTYEGPIKFNHLEPTVIDQSSC